MVTTVVDALPDRLWRGYPEDRHAEAFAETGRIRLRTLAYYRSIEDCVRRDQSEGIARLRVPGDVPVITLDASTMAVTKETTEPGFFHFQSQFTNPTYIFCLSTSEEAAVRFGNTLVEIFDPHRFLDSFVSSLDNLPEAEIAFVDAFPVRYDKDSVAPTPDHRDRARLSYGQKDPALAVEAEYRIAVVMAGGLEGAPEYLDLILQEPHRFARLVPPERAA
jgi:hypothetical protein